MNGCTETDKPLISIVMAVYEPNLSWFREQLDSLEAQTYPNLELLVLDDCSPTVLFGTVRQYVAQSIRSFPYQVARNEKNLGSNSTFEKLTQQAHGKYIAYCDQDDVWLLEKLEILYTEIQKKHAVMGYCDMTVMDAMGYQIAFSLRDIRPRLQYLYGENLFEQYFFRNCTAGSSMLIQADIAKMAIPFPPRTVADHWLAIWAAKKGSIAFTEQKMVKYRQHHNNQTGILFGVQDKTSYRHMRIAPLQERLDWLTCRDSVPSSFHAFVSARTQGDLIGIWKGRKYSSKEATLEIVMRFMPEAVFKFCIKRLKNENIGYRRGRAAWL